MRYQNLKSFQKHLLAARPDHVCHSYLVICADDYERGQILREIVPAVPVVSVAGALDALMPNLFGERPAVCLDEVEKLGKEEMKLLGENLPQEGYLLLGARKKVALSAMVEKEGVILDLSEEKPWDWEKRLAEQLSDRVQRAGKRLALDVPQLLFERLGKELATLDREIDKLLCFVGERPTIERVDVIRICGEGREETAWQVAEEIVWGEGRGGEGNFYALVPALRSQLQLGLKLASGGDVPKLWPKTLEKRRAQVERLGASYFERGLRLLFEVELLSRTGSNQEAALLERFRAGLRGR